MQTDIVGKFLSIATEEYADISVFLDDPIGYLDVSYREAKFNDNNSLYTEYLNTDGKIYTSVMKACNELISVNAYSEAILIYSNMIDVMKELLPSLSKDDAHNVKWSIDEMKDKLINTMKMRDNYYSKRKGVLAKYSDLTKRMK